MLADELDLVLLCLGLAALLCQSVTTSHFTPREASSEQDTARRARQRAAQRPAPRVRVARVYKGAQSCGGAMFGGRMARLLILFLAFTQGTSEIPRLAIAPLYAIS